MKPPREWDCVVCGAHVIGRPRSGTGKTCQAHRGWKPTTCATCGKQSYSQNPTKLGKRNGYCSPECTPVPQWLGDGVRASTTQLEWKRCVCQQWMCRPGRLYCGAECRRLATNRQARARWVSRPRVVRKASCMHCAVALGNTTRKTCDTCSVTGRQVRKGKHRARARHFGVEYEPVIAARVYARDGWRCGICRKPVDKHAKWPDQMCASIDHVTPMSKGGGHTYANTQCAHWLCNTLKSDRGSGEQLALVG